MILFTSLSLLILILYINHFSLYLSGWRKYPVVSKPAATPQVKISVVIAYRNEEGLLPECIDALKKQSYPADLVEVILVDDHSDDQSVALANKITMGDPRFVNAGNEAGEYGKKAAVAKGIRMASNELIALTDADCIPGERWLETIAAQFDATGAAMLIGLVDSVPPSKKWEQFMNYDLLSLVATGAAAVATGKPVYCNSANLAFRKSLFMQQQDPMNNSTVSGDDTFFLHKLKEDKSNRIGLLKSEDAVVITRENTGFRHFFNQRVRWASKSRFYRDRDIVLLSLLVLSVSLAMAFSVMLFLTLKNPVFFLIMLGLKCATDFIFLQDFMAFYKRKLQLGWLIVFEIIHPFYILGAAAAGFFGGFTWKGRKYSARGISSPVQK
jgi:poly-beta-1,6-N-acetyl-D-glucosamine synthase